MRPTAPRLPLVLATITAGLVTALVAPTAAVPVATSSAGSPVVVLAAKKPSATKAAKYLATSAPKKWTNAGSALSVGLGLAAAGCKQPKALKKIRTFLKKQAKSYATTAAAAGKLAIFAVAVGDKPASFGGVNLVARITANTAASGQVDGRDFSFGQALAMVGLARSGTKPNAAMVSYLLGQQHTDGGFGWGAGASDPDYTAMALLALSPKVVTATDQTRAAAAEAEAWATRNRHASGYWANFSPVDSTGLLGSALKLHGVDTAKSLAWLGGKQLTNGGFANTANGKKANALATSEALYLITGKSLVTLTARCSK